MTQSSVPQPRRDPSSGYSTITYGLQAVLDDLRADERMRGVKIDFGETKSDMPTTGHRVLMYPVDDRKSEGPDDQDIALPVFQLAAVGSTVVIPGDIPGAGAVSYSPLHAGRPVRVAHAAAKINEPLRLIVHGAEEAEAQLLVLLATDPATALVRVDGASLASAVARSSLGSRLRCTPLGDPGPVGESDLARMLVYAIRWQGCAFECYADTWADCDRLVNLVWSTLRGLYGPTFEDHTCGPLEEFHVQANVAYDFVGHFRVPIYEETPAVRLRRVDPDVRPRERGRDGPTAAARLPPAARVTSWWAQRKKP